jgi:hypothetical protein
MYTVTREELSVSLCVFRAPCFTHYEVIAKAELLYTMSCSTNRQVPQAVIKSVVSIRFPNKMNLPARGDDLALEVVSACFQHN